MKKVIYLFMLAAFLYACKGDAMSEGPGTTGKGGSTARFTIANDYLYTVDHQSLRVFSITAPDNPVFIKKINLYTVVETIFPLGDHLFVGTQTGMVIFDIQNPQNPVKVSVYAHIAACDPVVAEGNYAFVTLRSGTNCNRGVNLLDVIDITKLNDPKLVKSYSMTSPNGLGVDGNLLFVTEGDYGLKVFDKTDPKELKLIKHFQDFSAFDVIPNNNVLIITGKQGIYQYSYTDQNDLKLLSVIPIEL